MRSAQSRLIEDRQVSFAKIQNLIGFTMEWPKTTKAAKKSKKAVDKNETPPSKPKARRSRPFYKDTNGRFSKQPPVPVQIAL